MHEYWEYILHTMYISIFQELMMGLKSIPLTILVKTKAYLLILMALFPGNLKAFLPFFCHFFPRLQKRSSRVVVSRPAVLLYCMYSKALFIQKGITLCTTVCQARTSYRQAICKRDSYTFFFICPFFVISPADPHFFFLFLYPGGKQGSFWRCVCTA